MKHALPTVLLVLVLSSCATTGLITNTPASVIDDIVMLTPVSVITFQPRKGEAFISDSHSENSAKAISEAFLKSGLDITEIIELENTPEDDAIREEIASIAGIDFGKDKVKPIPEHIDRLVEASGKRYCLVAFSNGFTMDKSAYTKAMVTNFVLDLVCAIVTFGAVIPTSYTAAYQNNIYMAIFDCQADQAVYYNRSLSETDPLEAQSIRRQVKKIMNQFN